MADLNSLIAQGFQFKEPPDPFAQYAQMQQLQQGEQANQLNQMKMQEYQRGMAETNALRQLDPSSATYLQDVKRINPKTGFEFAKLQQEAKSAGTESQIKDVKLLADTLALLPEAYRRADTPEAYLALHRKIHADPVVGSWLSSIGATPEKGLAALKTAMDTGKFDELRAGSMQSVAQILDSMKPQPDAALMKQLGYPQTPEGFRAYQEAKRAPVAPAKTIGNVSPGDFTPASLAKFNASGNYGDLILKPVDRAPRPEPAVRTQQVKMDNGTIGIINMDTGAVTPATLGGAPVKGQPSALAEKTKLQQQQLTQNLGVVIGELKNAVKDGGLIDQSTGSGAGRLTDVTAGFFGKATPGAIAIGKLQPIADLALKMVPRFEGPQSNADTTSYKQAAGQLADANLPTKIRKEAAKTVIRLMENRKGQFMSSDMAAEGVAPSPTGSIRDQADAILRGQ
jgi:hypothetical protein